MKYLAFIFLLFVVYPSVGQLYNFKFYSVEDGLSHSAIWDMIEDQRGYLWFCGHGGGVSRFDGIEFKNFTVNDGLVDNMIISAEEDQAGNLWFGSENKGLSVYDGQSFTTYSVENGLLSNRIMNIESDRNGNIWILTDKGAMRYDGQTFHPLTTDQGLMFNIVNNMFEDQNGTLWLATLRGISRLKEGKMDSISLTVNGRKVGISSIAQMSDKNYLIGTYGNGLYAYDGENFIRYPEIDRLNGSYIHNIIKDRNGNFWLATESGGAIFFDGKNFQQFSSKEGLKYDYILNVMEDSWGNIWISMLDAGLAMYSGDAFVHYNKSTGLIGNSANEIIIDKNGHTWIGTNNGLSIMADTTITNYTENDGLTHQRILSVLEEEKGFWIGSYGGLDYFNGNKFIKLAAGGSFWDIARGPKGNIWVATANGVFEITGFNYSTYEITTYNHYLSGNDINIIATDEKNQLWVGTYRSGIFKYDGQEFKPLTEKDGLPSDLVYGISFDTKQNAWLATGKGLCRITDNKIYTYDEQTEIITGTPNALIHENDSLLWLGTTRGLFRIRISDDNEIHSIKSFGKSEGYAGVETNGTTPLKDSEGNIWFLTINGVTKISPGKLQPNVQSPATHITNIRLFFEEADWRNYSDSLDQWHNLPVSLTLPYDKNHLTFEFIGISTTIPEKVNYQWKLEGFDTEWSPISRRNEVTYSNIPFGTYTFSVKASNSDGIWNEQPITFAFTITPPFYFTWWFLLLATSFIFSVAYLGIRYRIKKIKDKEEAKRKMVEMELIALRAQMNPHFTFNTMNSIQHFIKKNETETALNYISKFSRLIRMILDNASVEFISIEREIEALKMYLDIEKLRFGQKFDYEIILDDEIDVSYDKIPSMILQPYVENAIWHGLMNKAEAGKITIEIKRTGDYIKCTVEDNGVGRDASRKYNSKHRTKHKSYGMLITSERLKLLNSEKHQELNVNIIDLHDEMGQAKGTRIEIKVFSEED